MQENPAFFKGLIPLVLIPSIYLYFLPPAGLAVKFCGIGLMLLVLNRDETGLWRGCVIARGAASGTEKRVDIRIFMDKVLDSNYGKV